MTTTAVTAAFCKPV